MILIELLIAISFAGSIDPMLQDNPSMDPRVSEGLNPLDPNEQCCDVDTFAEAGLNSNTLRLNSDTNPKKETDGRN
tara:strand:+ start:2880 stop:3107 length:228 start_codon:yes stop_codon:yes gene_type:complete